LHLTSTQKDKGLITHHIMSI